MRRAVDDHPPAVQSIRKRLHACGVGAMQIGLKAVRGVVCDGDRFLLVAVGDDREDRPEFSSRTIRIWLSTPKKIVGFVNQPRSRPAGRPRPPVRRPAPS